MKYFVLGGGKQEKAPDGGQAWVDAILRHVHENARIAFCNFASLEAEWETITKGYSDFMGRYLKGKKAEFQTMTIANFVQASTWANVVYLTGGNPFLLKDTLLGFGDVKPFWEDKTVVGSSAGAMVMCHKYVYLQEKQIGQGLGWVSCDLLAHYRSDFAGWKPEDWQLFEDQFSNDPASQQSVLCLPEGSFIELLS